MSNRSQTHRDTDAPDVTGTAEGAHLVQGEPVTASFKSASLQAISVSLVGDRLRRSQRAAVGSGAGTDDALEHPAQCCDSPKIEQL